MDPSSHKIYQTAEFSAKDFFDTYLSAKADTRLAEEFTIYPMTQLYKELSSGNIKGDTLIEFTIGPVMYKLLVCCEFFKEITILEFNAECSMELKNWLKNEPGGLDWSHMTQIACSLEGKSNGWKEKEDKVRDRVKRVIDYEDLIDQGTLSQSDCLLCVWSLDTISKDHDTFRHHLRNMVSLLKPGGHLVLFGIFNGTFYTVGNHKFHILTYDEEFLKAAVEEVGLVIESLERREGREVGGCVGYGSIYYVRAVKVGEVKK